MNTPFRQIARLMFKRTRRGQSLIIIAFAAIALIGFVGIATDVALMFVRYSTLRRAVDASAIAAAGQMRKGVDYTKLTAIAQEFISVHGLNVATIKVETCETEVDDWLVANPAITDQPVNPLNGLDDGTPGHKTKAQQAIDAISPNDTDALCKHTPEKLVRVSAQIASQTTFLSLLGFRTITLSSSSVSQTAQLDVALVLDASLSMAVDTYNHMGDTTAYPQTAYANWYDGTTENNNSVALMNFKDFTNRMPVNVNEASKGVAVTGAGNYDPNYVWGLGVMTNGSALVAEGQPSQPYNSNTAQDFGLRAIPFDGSGHPSYDGYTGQSLLNTNTTVQGTGVGQCQSGVTCTTFDTTVNNLMKQAQKHWIRYDCWYTPRLGSTLAHKANYGWAGCCNDPTVQSDDAAGNSTFNVASPTVGQFNGQADWYVYDDEKSGFRESVIMTTGTNQFNSTPAAKILYAGKDVGNTRLGIDPNAGNAAGDPHGVTGDGNYSDLICRPFKEVRDAARRFITRLDFTRGDRVVLVTFGADAKILTPYGATLPIISDAQHAIITLNMQAGVEVAPSHQNYFCASYGGNIQNLSGPASPFEDWGAQPIPVNQYYLGVNPNGVLNYWTATQCNDTNTGAGIATATNALVDPRYIRRDAVWVMVLLSDGYPNRTPPVGSFGIGLGPSAMPASVKYNFFYGAPNPVQDGTGVIYKDNACNTSHSGANDTFYKYCCAGDPVSSPAVAAGSLYGQQPQYCADMQLPSGVRNGWGWKFTDPLDPTNYGQIMHTTDPIVPAANTPPVFSFGFCPIVDYNYVSGTSPHYDTAGMATKFWSGGSFHFCNPPDPDTRHFCMDSNGGIFPVATGYVCDTYYDPMDYARDRVDFSGLDNYTKTQKGNFISMYSIYFAHISDNGQLNDNILGVKFMRYVADAGDNGQIDNTLQHWYRDARDGKFGLHGVNPPPTGGSGIVATTACATGTCTNPPRSPDIPASPVQDTLPWLSATNPQWAAAPWKYSTNGDPCAAYDYFFYDPGHASGLGTYNAATQDTFLNENASAAEKTEYQVGRAQQNCGQYFYATSKTLNQAFTSIASRLFTRLTQ